MEICNLNTQDEFSFEEMMKASKENRLLTLELELSLRCNYNCLYCYTPKHSDLKNEITFDEIKDIITQAKDLGARKIIILGGEPTVYPDFFDVVDFINSLDMGTEIFSNGSMITTEFAEKLYLRKVRVVLKLNSLNPDIMNRMTGRRKGFDNAVSAMENLKKAGYPDKDHFFGISTVISKYNENEVVDLWKWAKERSITPYFETITPQGMAKVNDDIFVKPVRIKEIFQEISKIDREVYGKEWDLQPPLVGSRCLRHLYSCLVDSFGNVKPCVGIDIVSGNIREKKLADIIKESSTIQDIKNYKTKIKGPCRKCEQADSCYGCRGAAYQLTGDPLASDPTCWRNTDKQDEIYSLPYPVEELIPQKCSMRMIDTLLKLGDRTAEACVEIKENNIFLDDNGELSESVFMELIAQTVAAVNGFYALENGEEQGAGFIIGAKKIKIYDKVKVGDKLKISIFRSIDLGDFGAISGWVHREDNLVAEGEIKVWGKAN